MSSARLGKGKTLTAKKKKRAGTIREMQHKRHLSTNHLFISTSQGAVRTPVKSERVGVSQPWQMIGGGREIRQAAIGIIHFLSYKTTVVSHHKEQVLPTSRADHLPTHTGNAE
eukprot:scpid54741/ scgid6368/ 